MPLITTNDFSLQAIKLNPTVDSRFYDRALVQFKVGHLEESIRDFSEAIALNPSQCVMKVGKETGGLFHEKFYRKGFKFCVGCAIVKVQKIALFFPFN